MSTRLLNDLSQILRIFQHRTGHKVIAVERLTLVIFLEERTLKHLQDGFVLNIRI